MSEPSRQLEEIVNAVPLGVVVLDDDHRVQLANMAAVAHLAQLGVVQSDAPLLFLGEHPIARLLAGLPGERMELQGAQRTFELMVSPIASTNGSQRWVLVTDDVTHAREVQQLAQVQDRLAAIGQLAAGIAHDFNNLLAVIMLHTQIGLLQPELAPGARECLDIILAQAVRAGDLVQQVLDYGRRAVLERRPLRLGPFVAEQVRLLERTLPENISVRFDEDAGEHTVSADPTRLQQVIVNLALNARDAMLAGGELKFALDAIQVQQRGAGPLPNLLPGAWVRLCVADTGHGIPPHVLPRIFDPFYTTKAPLGTGLGLAQVHGIVKQHEGEIDVVSEPGRGTTFVLYLPATRAAEPWPEPEVNDVLAIGHGETILVVEDDLSVRMALVASLEQLEYRALEAKNGKEALAILLRQPNTIDLVLSDMIMPEMGGLALLKAIKEHHIATPLAFLSGHPMDHDPLAPDQDEYAGWLQKPVTLEALAGLLARIVAGR